MAARAVKTFKKELGHRMHRDHRTHRRPLSKRQAALSRQYKRRKEEVVTDELDLSAKHFLLELGEYE